MHDTNKKCIFIHFNINLERFGYVLDLRIYCSFVFFFGYVHLLQETVVHVVEIGQALCIQSSAL